MPVGLNLGGSFVEEWRALLVRGCDAPPSGISAGHAWGSDGDCHDEEKSHDDEGEDPLECNDLSLELSDAKCRGEDTQREAHGVVLDKKTSISIWCSGLAEFSRKDIDLHCRQQ